MAELHINITPTTIQEGSGASFVATFYVTQNGNDPDPSTLSFNWNINSLPFGSPYDPAGGSDATFPNSFSGIISGFDGYGDTFEKTLTIAIPVTDALTENEEGFNFDISGLPTNLTIASGSSAENTLVIQDECFLAGTNILTEHGYRKIEDLKIGDRVKTFDGKLEEIKWIGKQTRYRFTARPLRSLPIQIKAGALGDNLPRRDLFVSPDHAILIEGLLINAGALENGVSIVKTYPETYVYYHIELENHTLLDAEGVAAESFFPNTEDRSLYDNGEEYEKLYPQGNKLMFWPMDYPRISSKNKVPLFVHENLLEIANQLKETKALFTA